MSLKLSDVSFTYPDGTKALSEVSLSVDDGESVAIVGQNGAGKTTLAKTLNGMLRPSRGDILIDDESLSSKTTAQLATTIGYVFQNPDDQLFLDSVHEELYFGPKSTGMVAAEIEEQLSIIAPLVGLSAKLDQHPFDLSATEKKFCTIGSVLMMNPGIVVFDEPTCGQDLAGNRQLSRIIAGLRDSGTTCITISHDMKFVVENFQRTVVMRQGQVLLDGSTRDVFARPEVLKESFVSPPPVVQVAQGAGLTQTPLTVQELITEITQIRSRDSQDFNPDGNTRKSLHAKHN